MSESQCYLCGKLGKFEKLFRGCKHESACYKCLRSCYVIQAQHKVSKYPLQCFHPECNLVIRTPHMERLVKSKQELQTYHRLSAKAKMNKLRLGDNWQQVMEILGEALGNIEICRCPGCQMLITKNGGCDHMVCICGCDFDWYYYRRSIEEIEKKYHRMDLCHSSGGTSAPSGKPKKAPFLRIDDDFVEDLDDYSVRSESSVDDVDFQVTVETVHAKNAGAHSVSLPAIDLLSVPSDIDTLPSLEAVAEASIVDVNPETDCWEHDYDVLELASEASNDSWSHFDESTIAADDDIQSSSSQATWEEVSDVSSVVSFHSKTGMSFLEVARETASNQTTTKSNGWKMVSKVPKPTIRLATITEDIKPRTAHDYDSEEYDPMFDADFMMEGVKYSRGGKQKFMFKHQPKKKYRRWDQRQRCSARHRW